MSRRTAKLRARTSERPKVEATVNGYRNGHFFPLPQDTRQREAVPKLDFDVTRLISGNRHSETVSAARKVYAGNSQLRGLVRDKGSFVVGSAWQPNYLGEDQAFKADFDEVIGKRWFTNCDVRGGPFDFQQDVFLGSKSLDVDGDFFIGLTESDFGSPRIQPLEGHRIGSPPIAYSDLVPENSRVQPEYVGLRICNGIVYDDLMREVAFNILPADVTYGKVEWNLRPAGSLIHVWDPEWFSQGRGIPAIASGILDWFDISEIRDATKIKVKATSRIGVMEFNDTGRADPGPALMAAGTISGANAEINHRIIENGQISYFRANSGHKLEEFQSNQPPETWLGFMEHIVRGAHKGMDWPMEMYDMSKLGGAAVRGFVQQINRSVSRRQDLLWIPFLGAVLYAVARSISRGRLRRTVDWYNVGFKLPAVFSVDVGNDKSNRRADIAMGLASPTDVFEQEAQGDPFTVLNKKADFWNLVQQVAKTKGVPPEVLYNPASASQPALMSIVGNQNQPTQPSNEPEEEKEADE